MHRISILIVDDDPMIIDLIRAGMEDENWEISSALDGEEALQLIDRELPDLIILDIMLPGIDGMELCRQLSSRFSIPIIMLSGKVEMSNKIKCLNLGAADYVTKPFGVGELVARVKAVLRRSYPVQQISSQTTLIQDGLEIDFNAKQVIVQGQEKRLTPTEFNLLQLLATNSGKTLDYKYLLNKVWGAKYEIEKEYLHVYVGRLRSKIELDPQNPRYLVSVPGFGYLFRAAN